MVAAPAGGGVEHDAGLDHAPVGLHPHHFARARTAAGLDLDAGHFGQLVDMHAVGVGLGGVAPDHGIVADDAAGRVVERRLDGIAGMARDVDAGAQALDLVRPDQPGIDALQPVHLGPAAHGAHRRIRMRQGEVPALAEHDVEIEFRRHLLVQLHALVVEAHAFGGEIVAADDGGVASAAAGADVALFQHGHVGDAVIFGQIIGAGQPVGAAADDDDIVAGLQFVCLPHAGQ